MESIQIVKTKLLTTVFAAHLDAGGPQHVVPGATTL
jgi:hypothetical protein